MTNKPDFNQMAQAARVRREAAEAEAQEARTVELEQAAGDAHVAFADLFDNDTVPHEDKVARYRATIPVLGGEGAPAPTTAATAPAGGANTLDLSTFTDNQRKAIELIAGNDVSNGKLKVLTLVAQSPANRFHVRSDGTLADSESRTRRSSDSTSGTEPAPAEPTTATKKTAAKAEPTAKKAAPPKRQKDESTEDKPEGFLDKVLKSAKKGIENTKK